MRPLKRPPLSLSHTCTQGEHFSHPELVKAADEAGSTQQVLVWLSATAADKPTRQPITSRSCLGLSISAQPPPVLSTWTLLNMTWLAPAPPFPLPQPALFHPITAPTLLLTHNPYLGPLFLTNTHTKADLEACSTFLKGRSSCKPIRGARSIDHKAHS